MDKVNKVKISVIISWLISQFSWKSGSRSSADLVLPMGIIHLVRTQNFPENVRIKG